MGEIAKNIIRHSLSKKLASWCCCCVVSLPWPFRYMESALAEKLVPGMVSKHSKIVSGCRSDSIRILCTETSKSPFRSRVIVVVSLLSNLSKNIYIVKRYQRQIKNIIHLCSHFSVGLGPSLVWFWSTRLNIYWKIRIIVKISLLYLFSIPLTHVKKGQFLACSKSRFHLDTMYFAVSSV